MSPSQTLSQLKALLPPAPLPAGNYVGVVRVGNLLYTSGVLPMENGQLQHVGALGTWDVPIEKGQAAARLCILNALSLIDHTLGGDWSEFDRIVKVTGFVSSAANFYDQPLVMNGASDFLVEQFGEAGRHTRSAVGVASLPRNASVELELIVALH